MRRKAIGMLSMIYETVLMRCIQDYVRPSAASSISSRALKPVLPREGEESKERRRPFVASSGASLWPLAELHRLDITTRQQSNEAFILFGTDDARVSFPIIDEKAD